MSCGGAGDDFRALLHVTRFADNRVGPEGSSAIGSALERNSTLTSLNVCGESTLAAMKVAAMISGRVIVRVC